MKYRNDGGKNRTNKNKSSSVCVRERVCGGVILYICIFKLLFMHAVYVENIDHRSKYVFVENTEKKLCQILQNIAIFSGHQKKTLRTNDTDGKENHHRQNKAGR